MPAKPVTLATDRMRSLHVHFCRVPNPCDPIVLRSPGSSQYRVFPRPESKTQSQNHPKYLLHFRLGTRSWLLRRVISGGSVIVFLEYPSIELWEPFVGWLSWTAGQGDINQYSRRARSVDPQHCQLLLFPYVRYGHIAPVGQLTLPKVTKILRSGSGISMFQPRRTSNGAMCTYNQYPKSFTFPLLSNLVPQAYSIKIGNSGGVPLNRYLHHWEPHVKQGS
jgi:hypothetical protein